MLLQDRGGERDTEVLSRVSQRAGQHGRVIARHLQPGFEVLALVASVRRVEPDHVGEEDRVELAALQGAGQADPVFEVVEIGLASPGATPGALDDMAGGVHHEGRETQWTRRGRHSGGHG